MDYLHVVRARSAARPWFEQSVTLVRCTTMIKWEFLFAFHFFMFKWKRSRKPLISISELVFLSVKGKNSIPITRGSADQSVSQILG